MHHLILGAGIAGTTAAEELRKLRPTDDITLVSEEYGPVYSRVVLPHYIKGKVPRERVFLKKPDWYHTQRIDWMEGVIATHIDTKNQSVTLTSGRELGYDKLLIATGGNVRTLEDNLRGISYFRTLDDADHMLSLLKEQSPHTPLVVSGGGFIACEYINIFAHYQHPTTVICRGPWFWSRVLSKESGELINTHIQAKGVTLVTQANITSLQGDTSLESIVYTKNNIAHTLQTPFLGIGMGIESEKSLFADANIPFNQGVLCNAKLETTIPNVYTAGDVAEFEDLIVERTHMAGNWQSAVTQGRVVAQNMTGTQTEFRLVTSYATNVLGLEIIFIGDTSRDHADHVKVSHKNKGIADLFFRQSRLVGAVLVNRNTDRALVSKLIQDKQPIDPSILD